MVSTRSKNFNTLRNNALTNNTLVMLLAGGRGSRLHELTGSRAKPALEFGCGYRIIDFPLSNCVNSGFKKIGVLTHYKAQTLTHHLTHAWDKFNHSFGEFLEIMPASQQSASQYYKGTADSLFQNIEFIKSVMPKHVLILSGDHIYKMDYGNILEQHVNSGADLTISCIEVPRHKAAGQFGVVNVDTEDRITSFEEKPRHPKGLIDRPSHVLASMGNYVFNTDVLIKLLQEDALDPNSEHDFGNDIIPKMLSKHNLQAFRFRSLNSGDLPYWRDVGTIDAYWKANIALLEHKPAIELNNFEWPIWSSRNCLPAVKFVSDEFNVSGSTINSLLSNGCEIHPCQIKNSLIFENTRIYSNAYVDKSVILPNVTIGKNSLVKNAIIDRACCVPENFKIGMDAEEDQRRGFRITQGGIVLVTQTMLDKLLIKPVKEAPLHASSKVTIFQPGVLHKNTLQLCENH